jgi:hypothetical protein
MLLPTPGTCDGCEKWELHLGFGKFDPTSRRRTTKDPLLSHGSHLIEELFRPLESESLFFFGQIEGFPSFVCPRRHTPTGFVMIDMDRAAFFSIDIWTLLSGVLAIFTKMAIDPHQQFVTITGTDVTDEIVVLVDTWGIEGRWSVTFGATAYPAIHENPLEHQSSSVFALPLIAQSRPAHPTVKPRNQTAKKDHIRDPPPHRGPVLG